MSFELITRNERFEEDFFSFLRSLANSYRVAYVTSSREELQLMCHNRDISDSPFFNIFSNLPLRPFSRGEALELVTVPSKREGVPLEEHAGRIIDLAGLFPFFLQIACSSAFEFLLDNPDAEPDWEQISRTFEEEAVPHYSFVWERFDEAERGNLVRIASGKAIDRKYRYVNENLERRGYLIETDEGPMLCSKSFEGFIRQKTGDESGGGSKFPSLFGRLRRGWGR
ncbi:MAG TPA: hypothetical protein VMX58_06755 [Patescibacteria group bacterium]|nr:hypothetical protein [Patescibacteria group bacterium]